MNLILDEVTIPILSYNKGENNNSIKICAELNENKYKDIIIKHPSIITIEGENFYNMSLISYYERDNKSFFVFSNNKNIKDILTKEEIYEINDITSDIISLLNNKEIPDKYNNFLQKLTYKTANSIEINKLCGYTMLSKDWLDDLANWIDNKKVLEIGAGTGAFALQLLKRNIDIVPIDNRSWDRFNWKDEINQWTDVLNEDYFEVYEKYLDRDIIILSYPVQGNYSYELLKLIREKNPSSLIIYIGPFKEDYIDKNFIENVTLIEDENFKKISDKYFYWIGQPYMSSKLLLLK